MCMIEIKKYTNKINKDSVAFNSLMLAFSAILLQVLSFVYRIVLSRVGLGDGMGLYQLVMPIYSLMLSFCISGISLAISRKVPALKREQSRTINRIQRFGLGLFLLFFGVVSSLALVFADSIAVSVLKNPQTKTILLLMIPCLFLTGIENITKSFFHSVKYVLPPIVSETTEQIVRIASLLALSIIYKPQNAQAFCVLVVSAMIISEFFSIAILYIFYKLWYKKRVKTTPNLEKKPAKIDVKVMMGIIIPVSFGSTFTNLLYTINTIIIPDRLEQSGLDPTAAIAQFGVMLGMTMPLLMLPSCLLSPIITVIMPRIAGSYERKNSLDVKKKTIKLLNITGLIVLPIITFLVAFGKDLAYLIFNQKTAGNFMFPLAIMTLFLFYDMVLSCILNGVGKQKRVVVNCVVAAIIEFIITYFFIPAYGIDSFVIGHMIVSILATLDLLIVLNKAINPRLTFSKILLNPIIASALSIITCLFVDMAFTCEYPDLLRIFIAVLVMSIMYLFSINYLGVKLFRKFKEAFMSY